MGKVAMEGMVVTAAMEATEVKEVTEASEVMVATGVVETIVGDEVATPVDLLGNWRQMQTPSSRSP